MASFNQVILIGNLTRDPQMKYLPSGTAVAEFGIAMNRKFRTQQGEDREEVTFVDVSAFAKTGELINQYFTKGKPIFIQGRLKYDQWDDKNGGGKRSKLTVVVDNFQFVGGREGGGQGGQGGYGGGAPSGGYDSEPGYDAPPPPQQQRAPMNRPAGGPPNRGPAPARQPSAPPPQAEPPFGDEQQFKDDDIPF